MHIRWLHESELRSVQYYNAEVIIGMYVSNVVRWQPRRGSVRRKRNLPIGGKIVHPGVKRGIQLHKVRIDAPFLLLLDSRINIVHPPDIANDPGEISEVPGNVEFRIVNPRRWSGYTQIQRIRVDC
jgi:hypothetical protein